LGNPGYDHEPDNRKNMFECRIDVERHEPDDKRHEDAKDLADQDDVCIRRVIEGFVLLRGCLDYGHVENLFAANVLRDLAPRTTYDIACLVVIR
jgi:hypothetical protein